ncbi:MAG: hypothetical protein JXA13_01175 [Anaerolineales bacterium]|nr:hypothetical protein [Anaerolineales bacterium]
MADCSLCQKHRDEIAQPPGGNIYEGEHWRFCHVPLEKGPLGTLFVESRRHMVDFGELSPAETSSDGVLPGKVYPALKTLTGAKRICQGTLLEGIPHFHTWRTPRRPQDEERGLAFLIEDLTREETDAAALTAHLQSAAKISELKFWFLKVIYWIQV